MLTAANTDAQKLEGFACGADDYITKPAQVDELMARIRAGLRIVTLQKQLLELSQTDPLTALRNRRAFDEHLGEAFEHARRYDRPLSLAVVDVDHFKSINDRYSHAVGDRVLSTIGGALKDAIRGSDLAVRWGWPYIVGLTEVRSNSPSMGMIGMGWLGPRGNESLFGQPFARM